MLTLSEQFLVDVEAFIEGHRMTATEFGKRFANSSSFVSSLRLGRSVGTRVMDGVYSKMREYDAKEFSET